MKDKKSARTTTGVAMNETLPRMVLGRATLRRSRTALRRKEEGRWRDIPWEEFESRLRAFGKGLLALGLAPGERVAIMAPNGPEWAYADLGGMAAGAVTVPLYHTEGVDAAVHILRDSGSRFLFLRSAVVAGELLERLDETPQLERLILLEGGSDDPRAIPLETFLEGAKAIPEAELEHRLRDGDPQQTATIVYTSGTTGQPKGVILSHANILSNVEAAARLFPLGETDRCLSFLPLSHIFERVDGYYFMLRQGTVVAYAESIESVPANLLEVQPTVALSVPRLFEKMFARIMEQVLGGPWLRKQLFFGALHASRSCVRREASGARPGLLLRGLTRLCRQTVFARLRRHLGGRLRFFISGGAPLAGDVDEFFRAAGIPIYQGYGLTETAAGIAVNTPQRQRPGSVGRPFPGTEVRLADDGEILVRGPGVFQGYWNLPEETARVFADGWFLTGDVGEIDAEGFLSITDRKKDLIITAGGENIAPQFLENLFKTDKYIANIMVCGDRKPFLTALIVPNLDNLEQYARHHRIDFLNHCDLVRHPRLLELVRQRIDRLQAGLPSFQRIKRFTLLSRDFTKEEMTPTMKVKRNVVMAHFHRLVEEMYLPQDHGVHDSGFCHVEEVAEAAAAERAEDR
jgi:long-chain acyl-CoA synthetase